MLLPVAKPSIVTYTHHAYPLAIAQAYPGGDRYLVGSFLQLYTRRNKAGNALHIDFYAYNGYYPECPFVEKIYETEESLSHYGASPVEQICAILDKGFYVEIIVDEYYIPIKAAYKRFHFHHQNLIYGYMPDSRVFLVQGFNSEGHYTDSTVRYEDMAAAAAQSCNVRRYAVKQLRQEEAAAVYQPDKARRLLGDFIASRCSVGARDPLQRDVPVRKAYGMATYDVAAELVECSNGKTIDLRPWCLFYEHKQQVRRLAQFLRAERGAGIAPALLEGLDSIVDDFFALRNYMLESRALDRRVSQASLRGNLDRLAAAEKDAIAELIQAVQ
jgi:hypothetical protein